MTSNFKKELKKRVRPGVKLEKRSSLLYVRIKGTNSKFLKAEAKKQNTTVTELVDTIFDAARGA